MSKFSVGDEISSSSRATAAVAVVVAVNNDPKSHSTPVTYDLEIIHVGPNSMVTLGPYKDVEEDTIKTWTLTREYKNRKKVKKALGV